MMYLPHDTEQDVIYVFATKAGAPSNPDWYHNLTAAGDGSVVAERIGADAVAPYERNRHGEPAAGATRRTASGTDLAACVTDIDIQGRYASHKIRDYFNDDQSEHGPREVPGLRGAHRALRTLASSWRRSSQRAPSPANSSVSRAQSSERTWPTARSVALRLTCRCRHRSRAWARLLRAVAAF
jgi:hypothetical protein